MNSNLSILKKGLILVAIPVAFQCVFLALVIFTQRAVTEAQGWAIHTKEVIVRTESIYRRLIEEQAAIRGLVLTGDVARYEVFASETATVPAELDALVGFVADNKPQQVKAQVIAELAMQYAAGQTATAALVKNGRAKEALEQVKNPDNPRRLDAIRRAIDEFRRVEEALDAERLATLKATTSAQLIVMIGGGLLALCGTLALLVFFARGIAIKFAVLGENAHRLAEGQELAAPLAGRDEIAELDRVFHSMAKSLAEKDRENELFIYSVSHDLRSPLVNLQGFSQELGHASGELRRLFATQGVPEWVRNEGERLVDREVTESIHFIQTAVSRLSLIIDGLLRLSRVGRVEYRWQAVDVNVVAGRVIEALGSTIAERGAKVTAAKDLPEAWGDPTAVEQIFANLIGNAVNYLDPARPGMVHVGVLDAEAGGASPSNASGHRTYYVKDNGLGIPESGRSKMFLAFQRFHDARARGEGIGLALVRKIVERHGGRIWVESTPGAGSTFFVDLPTPEAPPLAREPARTVDATPIREPVL